MVFDYLTKDLVGRIKVEPSETPLVKMNKVTLDILSIIDLYGIHADSHGVDDKSCLIYDERNREKLYLVCLGHTKGKKPTIDIHTLSERMLSVTLDGLYRID